MFFYMMKRKSSSGGSQDGSKGELPRVKQASLQINLYFDSLFLTSGFRGTPARTNMMSSMVNHIVSQLLMVNLIKLKAHVWSSAWITCTLHSLHRMIWLWLYLGAGNWAGTTVPGTVVQGQVIGVGGALLPSHRVGLACIVQRARRPSKDRMSYLAPRSAS